MTMVSKRLIASGVVKGLGPEGAGVLRHPTPKSWLVAEKAFISLLQIKQQNLYNSEHERQASCTILLTAGSTEGYTR